MSNLPYTIETIITQLGGRGLRGALVYTGTHKMGFTQKTNFQSHFGDGFVFQGVGLTLHVNGKPKEDWQISVSYEPNDTYTVRLTAGSSKRKLLDEAEEIYCDNLKETVEFMYDAAIRKFNGGFINI